jgi:hypothetical protein
MSAQPSRQQEIRDSLVRAQDDPAALAKEVEEILKGRVRPWRTDPDNEPAHVLEEIVYLDGMTDDLPVLVSEAVGEHLAAVAQDAEPGRLHGLSAAVWVRQLLIAASGLPRTQGCYEGLRACAAREADISQALREWDQSIPSLAVNARIVQQWGREFGSRWLEMIRGLEPNSCTTQEIILPFEAVMHMPVHDGGEPPNWPSIAKALDALDQGLQDDPRWPQVLQKLCDRLGRLFRPSEVRKCLPGFLRPPLALAIRQAFGKPQVKESEVPRILPESLWPAGLMKIFFPKMPSRPALPRTLPSAEPDVLLEFNDELRQVASRGDAVQCATC